MPKRIDWSNTPVTFSYREPCPHCQSRRKPKPYTGPLSQGDESEMRLVVCRDCKQAYRDVEELFVSGVDVLKITD